MDIVYCRTRDIEILKRRAVPAPATVDAGQQPVAVQVGNDKIAFSWSYVS